MKTFVGPSNGPILAKSEINVGKLIRYRRLIIRVSQKRESDGLTIKQAATKLNLSPYELEEIENGNLQNLKPKILKRYLSFLGLNDWLKGWVETNPTLAKELNLNEEENR